MTPRFGRALHGARAIGRTPFARWQTTTFLAALRTDGVCASLVLDGAIDGLSLRAWVEPFLAPVLQAGDVVVMDNLGSHKVAGIRETIEVRGAGLRYLPPYSPDLNPIEQVSAKLKGLLRRAGERTHHALWDRIGGLLDRFAPDECRRYLEHCGYRGSG
jgi:transposase